eukprot:9941053-Alexandrium_andersonii.AAC.1
MWPSTRGQFRASGRACTDGVGRPQPGHFRPSRGPSFAGSAAWRATASASTARSAKGRQAQRGAWAIRPG